MSLQTLHWYSPRGDEPASIKIILDPASAEWILDYLPSGDRATEELRAAVTAVRATAGKPAP